VDAKKRTADLGVVCSRRAAKRTTAKLGSKRAINHLSYSITLHVEG